MLPLIECRSRQAPDPFPLASLPTEPEADESVVAFWQSLLRQMQTSRAEDRPLAGDIEAVAEAIRNGGFVEAVEPEVGGLR